MVKTFVLFVIALLSLTACGSAPAVEQPTAVPTLLPTVVPRPTAQPTEVAVALPGLGLTRAEAQAKFEAAPFNFTFRDVSTDKDGPSVTGVSSVKGLEIHLRGPAKNIHEAQVSAIINDTNSGDVLRAMIALLEVAAPKIKDPTLWLKPHLDKALKTGTDAAIEGDRTIMLIAQTDAKILILSVLPGLK